jgi:hypothetical protein
LCDFIKHILTSGSRESPICAILLRFPPEKRSQNLNRYLVVTRNNSIQFNLMLDTCGSCPLAVTATIYYFRFAPFTQFPVKKFAFFQKNLAKFSSISRPSTNGDQYKIHIVQKSPCTKGLFFERQNFNLYMIILFLYYQVCHASTYVIFKGVYYLVFTIYYYY